MQNEDHRRAWRLLQEVPEGQKSAFIVRAILQMDQEDRLETMLRRVLMDQGRRSERGTAHRISRVPCF